MSINVFTGYYEDNNPTRNEELLECIRQNILNPYINYVLIESDKRMKYNEYFKIINEYSDPNDVNIIMNLDIYLDPCTCHLLERIKPREMFALCRWERKKDGQIKFADRPDSQDVWVFRGYIDVNCDFYIGYAGCDNRIAKIFSDIGWRVTNPGKSIKTIHVHSSNIRNYKPGKHNTMVVEGPYLTLPPTSLEGM
jgi:hypothetical protein